MPQTVTVPDEYDLKSASRHFFLAYPKESAGGNEAEIPDKIAESALAFALFGWHAESSKDIGDLAVCSACFRRIGLWMWLPRVREGEELEPCISKMRVSDEHRHYCPWIDVTSQCGSDSTDKENEIKGEACWETLANVLANSQYRDSIDGSATLPGTAACLTGPETRSDNAILEGNEVREAKDKERWAKLKRLKQKMFRVRNTIDVGKDALKRPSTAL